MDGVAKLGVQLNATGIEVALQVLHSVDVMGRMDVPALPPLSPRLHALVTASRPSSVPPELKSEFEQFANARLMRANAKGENVRRLRSLLWAEAKLREAGRDEWTVLREFNGFEWGVEYPASFDYSDREAQLTAALHG